MMLLIICLASSPSTLPSMPTITIWPIFSSRVGLSSCSLMGSGFSCCSPALLFVVVARISWEWPIKSVCQQVPCQYSCADKKIMINNHFLIMLPPLSKNNYRDQGRRSPGQSRRAIRRSTVPPGEARKCTIPPVQTPSNRRRLVPPHEDETGADLLHEAKSHTNFPHMDDSPHRPPPRVPVPRQPPTGHDLIKPYRRSNNLSLLSVLFA